MFIDKHGYSLVELLITLSIASIAYMWGMPVLGSWLESYHVKHQSFELQRMLNLARQKAIERGSYIAICPLDAANHCTNQWNGELTVFENKNNNSQLDFNEKVVHKFKGVENAEGLRSFNGTKIAFNSQGFSGFGNGSLSYCLKGQPISKGVVFIIARSGRVRSAIRLNESTRLPSLASGQNMPCR